MATLSSSLLSSSPLCKSRFSPSRTDFISFSPRRTLSAVSPAILSLSVKHHRCRNSFQVRSVASPAETASEFDEMVSGTKRNFICFVPLKPNEKVQQKDIEQCNYADQEHINP
ncbi:hypothetical protein F2Q70_00036613 [Brassica cretica]|uniref:Uncharacterized protein n=1 Tax=Brassica cretica TaxID=69181 RepID=A0A8S9JQ39_BRACR|nr:hypothetical protein F2Q70_00036613 [Brassica cretica]